MKKKQAIEERLKTLTAEELDHFERMLDVVESEDEDELRRFIFSLTKTEVRRFKEIFQCLSEQD